MAETPSTPPWERVALRSAGVDIGSATSQVVLSEITMAKIGKRFAAVQRRVIHQSPVLLTPYLRGNAIDVGWLVRFVDAQFRKAGMSRADIDCGVVILTGTALDRANSRLAADLVASSSGAFVTVSAGDTLEAALAAHGSGAVAASRAGGPEVLSVDIGGGTTKFAVCRDGRIEATAAIDVGARLVVVDNSGIVTRLEPAARDIAARTGLAIEVGASVSATDFADLAAYLADQIWASAGLGGRMPADPALARTAPLPAGTGTRRIMFSGGVAQFLSEHARVPLPGRAPGNDPFGDLGSAIAHEIRRLLEREPGIVVDVCPEGIRSTVLGAAMFTVQLSGDTLHVSRTGVLPLRDVPVVAPGCTPSAGERAIAGSVATALGRAVEPTFRGPLAIALRWEGSATLDRLTGMAGGLAAGLAVLRSWSGPLVVVCDDDVGLLLGRHVQHAMPEVDVVSLDGIDVRDLDFIDIAEPPDGTLAVPVTVKSLVFGPAAG